LPLAPLAAVRKGAAGVRVATIPPRSLTPGTNLGRPHGLEPGSQKLLDLERVVVADAVEETIAATSPRPRARSGGRATMAGLAARSGSPNGLEPVLAERGEVDHQVDGVCQTRR